MYQCTLLQLDSYQSLFLFIHLAVDLYELYQPLLIPVILSAIDSTLLYRTLFNSLMLYIFVINEVTVLCRWDVHLAC